MKKEKELNDFISLKLEKCASLEDFDYNERYTTNIYVNGKLFRQCKYLLLNLTKKDFHKYEQIDSIDQAFEIYNNRKDRSNEGDKIILDPDTEFMGHCSNLQAWIENNYNPNILHTSLSFPLLSELTKAGDKKAKAVFKEEIINRLKDGDLKTMTFFIVEHNYLIHFNYEELEVILDMIYNKINDENNSNIKKDRSLSSKILFRIKRFMNTRFVIEPLLEKGVNKFTKHIYP